MDVGQALEKWLCNDKNWPTFPIARLAPESQTRMFYYFFIIPGLIGFSIGLAVAVQQRKENSRLLRAAKDRIATLIGSSDNDLRSVSKEVIQIFEDHKFNIANQTDEEIVFSHRNPIGIDFLGYVLWSILSLSGFLFYCLAYYFFSGARERITVRLVW